MATTIVPNFNVNLTGKGILTELSKTYSFQIVTKLEQSYSLNNLDPEQTIDLSDIASIRYMIFESDYPFNLTINKGLTPQEIIFPVKDIFIYSPDTGFVTNLNSIKVQATSSTTKQTITVRVYGA